MIYRTCLLFSLKTTSYYIRVLRPLRTFTKIKRLKALIASILVSLRSLSDVVLLFIFLLVIFSIFGVQTFNGLLHQQCFAQDFRPNSVDENIWLNNDLYFQNGEYFCYEVGNNNFHNNGCPQQYPWCLDIAPNPNSGLTTFDNFLFGILNVFISASLEGWSNIMYMLQDAGSNYCWIYFILLTFITGFFVTNLFLGMVEAMDNNEDHQHYAKYRKRAMSATEKVWKQMQILSNINNIEKEDNFRGIFFEASNAHRFSYYNTNHHDQRRITQTKSMTSKNNIERQLGIGSNAFMQMYRSHTMTSVVEDNETDSDIDKFIFDYDMNDDVNIEKDNKIKHKLNEVMIKVSAKHIMNMPTTLSEVSWSENKEMGTENDIFSSLKRIKTYNSYNNIDIDDYNSDCKEESNLHCSIPLGPLNCRDQIEQLEKIQKQMEKTRKENEILARTAINIANDPPNWVEYINKKRRFQTHIKLIKIINAIVISDWFTNFIIAVIILNTICLAMKWPSISENTVYKVEKLNLFCIVIFIMECVLKLIGFGYKSYFKNNWNKFDFFVVITSLIELIFPINYFSAIPALKSLRLLRIFRLINKFNSLQHVFTLVVRSISELVTLISLIAVITFMFALLGMSLFGGKLVSSELIDNRWRFDSIYWSIINVFIIITGDAWNEVMYDTVKVTGSKLSVIYFVTLICFGIFFIIIMLQNNYVTMIWETRILIRERNTLGI